jgi:hypothetical protein
MTTTTTTRTILRRDFTDALEAAGLNEYEITEGYSGRGMYGATCFGVTVEPSNLRYVYAALGYTMGSAEAADDDMETAEALLRTAAWDSMGRDFIVYFPGWSLAG